jgi:Uma2 family endonuclease
VADPARKLATYEELCAVPRQLVAEIIDGVLRTHPRPAPPHARAASKLGAKLDRVFDEGEGGPGGWSILDEPEIHFANGDILVPDLASWRVERMAQLPTTAYFEIAPDWVCEVLSPSTEAEDRADKMPSYAASEVGHVWLIDPLLRTLEVFRLEAKRWTLLTTVRGDARVRAEPFKELKLDLSSLWGVPRGR